MMNESMTGMKYMKVGEEITREENDKQGKRENERKIMESLEE